MSKVKLGWKPDVPDNRDYKYEIVKKAVVQKVDLTSKMPPVYDQGDLGSCTANAIAAAYEFDLKRQKLVDFVPSRLFIYYNERDIEGTVDYDAGAEIRDGIKSINQQGTCHETLWPYDIDKFTDRPTDNCYTDASHHKSVVYRRVPQTLTAMKACIAEGFPFVFGFAVYESFMSDQVASTGVMPMPNFRTEEMVGGHAVCAVGYDDKKKVMICRNSWGTSWGQQGYFTMPYSYIANNNLCDDFWTVRAVL